MHCSLCRDATHRKSNCPSKNGVPDEEGDIRDFEQGQSSVKSSADVVKKKSSKELRRKKLQTRKQVKKTVVVEQPNGEGEVPVQSEVLVQGEVPIQGGVQEHVTSSGDKTKALKRQKLQVRRNVKKVEKAQEDEAAVGTQEEEPVVTQEVPWTEVTIPKKRLPFLKDDNPAGKDFCW